MKVDVWFSKLDRIVGWAIFNDETGDLEEMEYTGTDIGSDLLTMKDKNGNPILWSGILKIKSSASCHSPNQTGSPS